MSELAILLGLTMKLKSYEVQYIVAYSKNSKILSNALDSSRKSLAIIRDSSRLLKIIMIGLMISAENAKNSPKFLKITR